MGTTTAITDAKKKTTNKADEKQLADNLAKFGKDIDAIERRKSSCMKLVRSSFRSVELIVTKADTDPVYAAEMALEHIEDARAKLDKIEELVAKIKDAS